MRGRGVFIVYSIVAPLAWASPSPDHARGVRPSDKSVVVMLGELKTVDLWRFPQTAGRSPQETTRVTWRSGRCIRCNGYGPSKARLRTSPWLFLPMAATSRPQAPTARSTSGSSRTTNCHYPSRYPGALFTRSDIRPMETGSQPDAGTVWYACIPSAASLHAFGDIIAGIIVVESLAEAHRPSMITVLPEVRRPRYLST